MKTCTKCLTPKQEGEFHAHRRGKAGLSAWCKACHRIARQAWRNSNRDRDKANDVAWRKANPEKVAANRLRSTYGIDDDPRTNAACALCGSGSRLAIDHDHTCCPGSRSCGKCIRGVLCRTCNLGLGHFKDDPALLRAALSYLGEK